MNRMGNSWTVWAKELQRMEEVSDEVDSVAGGIIVNGSPLCWWNCGNTGSLPHVVSIFNCLDGGNQRLDGLMAHAITLIHV